MAAIQYIRIANPKFLELDNNGRPAAGYLVYTLAAGTTSTLVTTYSNRELTAANTNPIVLNARGEADIFTNVSIKLVYCAPGGTLASPIWTEDYASEQLNTIAENGLASGFAANVYKVDTTPLYATIPDMLSLVMLPDATNYDTLEYPDKATAQTFNNVGINDLTWSGPYVGSIAGANFTVEIDSVAAAVDSYIKLLLHGDGSGATFVDSEITPKTVTANGDVTQSSAQYKFGGKSILFDGAGDYLSLTDHADWFLDTGNFTIDFWVRFIATTSATFVSQNQDATNTMYFDWDAATGKIRFYFQDSGSDIANYDYSWLPAVDTWYHLELVRSGTNLYLYIDGTKITWTTIGTAIAAQSLANHTGLLTVGYGARIGTYLNGYIDEFCWSKGIARNTGATFDVPTQAYSASGVDTFTWKVDGIVKASLVAITAAYGVPQDLQEGVAISFADNIGHTLGAIWNLVVMTPARLNFCGLGNDIIYKNVNGDLKALDGGDIVLDYPAHLDRTNSQSAWILLNPSLPVLEEIRPTRARKNLSSDYTIQLGDNGLELSCNGTFNVNLPLCTTIPNIFVWLHNQGSGLITFAVAAGAPALELIYRPFDTAGATTYTLVPGASIMFETNGVDVHILSETVKQGGYQLFTTLGANDFIWPYGVDAVKLTMCGGGGGGGAGDAITAGGHGAFPNRTIEYITGGTGGTTYVVTIGGGGAAGVGPGAAGGAGGDSSFAAFKTTGGGAGGPGASGTTTADLFWFGDPYGSKGQPGNGGAIGNNGDAGTIGFALIEW